MNEKKLTKLDALRILSNAYWYVFDVHSALIIYDAFGYVRRSLNLADLKPSFNGITEGLNGKMPTFF